jgi:hypothetical protein
MKTLSTVLAAILVIALFVSPSLGAITIKQNQVENLPANISRIAALETNLGSNATKATNSLAWLALNKTRIDTTNVYLGTNATKATNALAWLALNNTRVGTLEDDVGDLGELDSAGSDLVAAINDTYAIAVEGERDSDNALAWLALNNTRTTAVECRISHMTVIAGGAAGNHTVAGISVGDPIIGAVYISKAAGNLTGVVDLKAEFTVLANDVIENAGHTATSDGYIIFTWEDRTNPPT